MIVAQYMGFEVLRVVGDVVGVLLLTFLAGTAAGVFIHVLVVTEGGEVILTSRFRRLWCQTTFCPEGWAWPFPSSGMLLSA